MVAAWWPVSSRPNECTTHRSKHGTKMLNAFPSYCRHFFSSTNFTLWLNVARSLSPSLFPSIFLSNFVYLLNRFRILSGSLFFLSFPCLLNNFCKFFFIFFFLFLLIFCAFCAKVINSTISTKTKLIVKFVSHWIRTRFMEHFAKSSFYVFESSKKVCISKKTGP